jgi:transcriptional regulator with XRE-family HTH domain
MKPDKLRKYQYWEEGKHLPSVETLEDVASALAVSFDYLMTGGDDTPPAGDILTRLDRIEQALDRVLAHLEGKTVEDLEGEIEPAATKKPLPNEGTGE